MPPATSPSATHGPEPLAQHCERLAGGSIFETTSLSSSIALVVMHADRTDEKLPPALLCMLFGAGSILLVFGQDAGSTAAVAALYLLA